MLSTALKLLLTVLKFWTPPLIQVIYAKVLFCDTIMAGGHTEERAWQWSLSRR